MNKYEKIYLKAKGRSHGSDASWLDSAIAALAVDLMASGRRLSSPPTAAS